MSRSKKFSNLSLLEQIEVVIKKQLPKETNLKQIGLTVNYGLTMNVTTEDNPFELTSKEYIVEASYVDDELEIIIRDGEVAIKRLNIIQLEAE